jgi:thiosulfate/3-mercaptopyruvate sulfurtransferase
MMERKRNHLYERRDRIVKQQNLVSVQWLSEHAGDPDLVIVDCRFDLSKPSQGFTDYLQSHIPGALYFHLEHDLSAPKSQHGGRHPLPDIESLVRLFSSAGIHEQTMVIAYDEQDLAMAARLWWLLRYLGHEKAAVLDGGFAAWRRAGLAVTDEVPTPTASTFNAKLRPDMLVTVEQVKTRDAQTALLDSRAGERYRGEVEPLDPKAGHIPGALHYFYKENLNPDGTLRTPAELKQRFAPLDEKKEIIVYCGSGVTACVNVLALYEAGRTDAKLYAGSWSDWCSFNLPVATGPNPSEK